MWKEFKEFISQGNVMDLAVGVIIGGAFTAIVTALVDNIFTPILGIIVGGLDFSGLSIVVGDAVIQYGAFIQAVINFLLIAICLFFVVKSMNVINLAKKKQEEEDEAAEEVDEQTQLLTEIRDLLKKQ